ncbi:MAG: diguanylate cyclase [Motiliproteus sp.]
MVNRIKDLPDNPSADKPIGIADRVWWVGHYLKDDVFQCHCYLIEQGDQSVLIDPGSMLTFEHTLAKIEQIIPFSSIRYFICQHQDPDIVAAMPFIDAMITRSDALLVTHWRTHMLLKHYDLKMPFWLVDEHDWKLQLQDRTLSFVLTPYAHFPGAICTFDLETQVLFSSDLFGGMSEDFQLVASSESYFECMRPFHEHYMPSREVLNYAMAVIERLPAQLIAPQHGSLIPKWLIEPMIGRLKNLECGIYLLSHGDTDIKNLSKLNQTLRQITETMMLSRDFKDIANRLKEIIRHNLPIVSLEFYALFEDDKVLHLSPNTRYRGVKVKPDTHISKVLGSDRQHWKQLGDFECNSDDYCLIERENGASLYVPLFSPDKGTARALAILHLTSAITISGDLDQVIQQLIMPLQVAVDREVMYRVMDMERQKIYEQSVKDSLTGLFTRLYMKDVVQRLCEIQDREKGYQVSAVMMDIDHFKSVNDRYGHSRGDEVLRQVGQKIISSIRDSDLAVRFGGEEIIVFTAGKSAPQVSLLAERLRMAVENLEVEGLEEHGPVTVSLGTAMRHQGELLNDLIERADRALYRAKEGGRNRVVNGLSNPV